LKSIPFSIALATALIANLTPARAASIDIPTDGNLINIWGPDVGPQSYGQIFTAPQPFLVDYSLTVFGTRPFNFVSQVFAWGGTGVSGNALYTSAIQTITGSMLTTTYSSGISLTPGQQYIAFVTPNPGGVALGGSGYGFMAGNLRYGANNFRYAVFDPSKPGNWGPRFGDAQFHADFSAGAVPEPANWAMLIAGFGLVGAAMRRRRVAVVIA
jgi:hypothetical protein